MLFIQKTIFAIGIALVMLLGIGVFSYDTVIQENADQQLVAHTYLVMETLARIQTNLIDAGAAQRGYLISGDDSDLTPYHSALLELQENIESLRKLTSDNPEQQNALPQLQADALARIAELQERIDLRKRTRSVPPQQGLAINQAMNRVRSEVAAMTQTEQLLLTHRAKAAAVSASRMKTIILFGNLIAIVLLCSAGVFIYQEMSKRAAAEKLLRASEEKLLVANRELEAFSYSVSHDLRAPLRSIDGFADALVDDYGDAMDTQGRDYLSRIRGSAQRMSKLIDGLLDLARIGRSEIRVQSVDVSELARDVERELRDIEPNREVEFVIDSNIRAQGDPRLLRVVIENLLRNSWKYTSKRRVASIEVGRTKNNGHSAYFVRDNGSGFDAAYASKLFGVFQRLHRDDEFPGTGIGLATVQRIVQRHGGRIWAESAVDRGATFYFTL